MLAGYQRLLRPGLRYRGATLAFGLLWFFAGIALLTTGWVRREFVPPSDRGSLRVFTRAPEGATIDYTRRYQEQVEDVVRAIPELESYLSVVALGINTPGLVNEGIVIGTLRDERERSTAEIIADNFQAFWAVPGIEAWPSQPPSLGQNWISSPISVVLRGPDVESLARYADAVIARVGRELPDVQSLRSDLVLNKPQLDVVIDRNRASDLGVSVRDIATTLQILLGGSRSVHLQGGGPDLRRRGAAGERRAQPPGRYPPPLRAGRRRAAHPPDLRRPGARRRSAPRGAPLRSPARRDAHRLRHRGGPPSARSSPASARSPST